MQEIILPISERAAIGEYRKHDLFVHEDSLDYSIEAWKDRLVEKGGASEDVKTLTEFFKKMKRSAPNIQKAFRARTQTEKKVLDKIVYVPPVYEKIPEEMQEFAVELKQRLFEFTKHANGNIVEIAGWAHQKIAKIHPFDDGNGRTARGVMNAILRTGGQNVVIIPDDDEYTAAITQDHTHSGAFVDYLKKMIGWNQNRRIFS